MVFLLSTTLLTLLGFNVFNLFPFFGVENLGDFEEKTKTQ
jgi:hypothetical protein